MRLVVARCEVTYEGRLAAFLPMATRLIMVKADGCAIHADGGVQAAQLDERTQPPRRGGGSLGGRGLGGEQLTIVIEEVVSDSDHELGVDPGLEKDGVEAHLQQLLAAQPGAIIPDLTLVRREYPTDIGPVDLLCRDPDGGAVAIEVGDAARSTAWSSSPATWSA